MADNKLTDFLQNYVEANQPEIDEQLGLAPTEATEQHEAEEVSEQTNTVSETTNLTSVEDSHQEEQEDYFQPFYEEEVQLTSSETILNEDSGQVGKVKDKVKYNLEELLTPYEDQLQKYFKYKSLDISAMSDVDLLKYKLQKENPSFDENDIAEALKEDYGIGLKLKTIPEDALDSEIATIESYNERIQSEINKGKRRLKADVYSAKSILEAEKASISLPELELDVELNTDPTKIIEQYTQQIQAEAQKEVEEVWIPNITEAVNKVSGFKQPFEFEVQQGDKVVSELTYRLTDNQKAQLKEYLANYSAHPSDSKYVNSETNEVDYTRFVSDQAKKLFVDDIIKASVKEANAQFKAKFLKEEAVNFNDGTVRRTSNAEQPKDFATSVFESAQGYMRKR